MKAYGKGHFKYEYDYSRLCYVIHIRLYSINSGKGFLNICHNLGIRCHNIKLYKQDNQFCKFVAK